MGLAIDNATDRDVPSGMYPDPSGGRYLRLWNGTEWTDDVAPYAAPRAHEGLVQPHDGGALVTCAYVFGALGLVSVLPGIIGLICAIVAVGENRKSAKGALILAIAALVLWAVVFGVLIIGGLSG